MTTLTESVFEKGPFRPAPGKEADNQNRDSHGADNPNPKRERGVNPSRERQRRVSRR